MAQTYKVLGQVNPAADTVSNVYVVPAATQAVVNTITVANQGGSDAIVNIWVRPTNEALATKHHVVRQLAVPPADAVFFQLGLTLDATNILAANSNVATCSFGAFGVEIT